MAKKKKPKKDKKSKKSKKEKKSKKSKRSKHQSSSSSSSDEWAEATPTTINAPSQLFSHVEKTESSGCLLNFDNIGEEHTRKNVENKKSYLVAEERQAAMAAQRNIVNRSKEEASKSNRPKYSLDFLRRSFFGMKRESQEEHMLDFETIITNKYGSFDEFIGHVRKAEDFTGVKANWLGAKIPRNFKPKVQKTNFEKKQEHVVKIDENIDWNADLNKLTAKSMRAGIMGNKKLENEIKLQIRKIKDAQNDGSLENKQKDQTKAENTTEILPTTVTKTGSIQPANVKNQNLDESKMSIQELLQHERTLDRLGDESSIYKAAAKGVSGKGDGKLDLDDFYDNVSDKKRKHKEISNDKLERQLRDKAIASHKNQLKDRFFSGSADFPKHCIVHRTQNFYVMVTPWKPLVNGHLLIVPIEDGITSYLQLTRESLLDEYFTLQNFIKKSISSAYNLDCVFIHTCFNNGNQLYIEVLPLEKRDNSAVLGFFKQEILNSTGSQFNRDNQAIRKLDKNNKLHKVLPRALMPYFAVENWYDGCYKGYLHIIEDFHAFGKNFAYEVIGGLLEIGDMHEHKYKKNVSFDSALKRRKEVRLVFEVQHGVEDDDLEPVIDILEAKRPKTTNLPLPDDEGVIYGPCFIPK